jgi:hypothetical protein
MTRMAERGGHIEATGWTLESAIGPRPAVWVLARSFGFHGDRRTLDCDRDDRTKIVQVYLDEADGRRLTCERHVDLRGPSRSRCGDHLVMGVGACMMQLRPTSGASSGGWPRGSSTR